MKDLYALIGMASDASPERIREALPRMSAELRAMVSEVLLVPSRRTLYDKTRNQLIALARLRDAMDLSDAPFGRRPEYDAFRRAPPQPPPAREKTKGWGPPRAPADVGPTTTGGRINLVDAVMLVIAAMVVIPLIFVTRPEKTPGSSPPAPATQTVAPPVAPLVAQPMPSHGGFSVSALTSNWIDITSAAGGDYTYVKVYPLGGTNAAAVGMLYPGRTLRLYVDPGTYEIKTASGTQWYGYKDWFGPQTQFSKADSTFALTEPGAYYTVELIAQRDGNLRTKGISRSQF